MVTGAPRQRAPHLLAQHRAAHVHDAERADLDGATLTVVNEHTPHDS